jgi:hypothetical protein
MIRAVLLSLFSTLALFTPAVADVLWTGSHEVPQVPEVFEAPHLSHVRQAPPWCLEADCVQVCP